eukprot:469670_1
MAFSNSSDMEDTFVLFKLIVVQTLFVIFLPFFVYGVMKWIVFRQKMIIRKRFPMLSILMVGFAFLNCIIWLCVVWIEYTLLYEYEELGVAISFFCYGLVNLRLFLSYLRCKHNKTPFHDKLISSESEITSISRTETVENTPSNSETKIKRNLYTHWFSITILLLSFFGTFIIIATHVPIIITSCWMIMMLITIIQIVLIVVKKVNDGIGSTKEGLIMLVIFILTSFVNPLFHIDGWKYFAFTVASFTVYFQALIPLFIALYYIYKYDSTPDILSENENSPIFVFLEKKENYIVFAKYLNYCWALESLLFVERVSILYQIVLQCKETLSDTMDSQHKKQITRLKFTYLETIYTNYRNLIDNSCKDKNDLNQYKEALFVICQQICSEFIQANAVNQINISYETRRQLLFLLRND